MRKLEELENKIQYQFQNIEYMERALTHSSYNKEQKTKHKDNERLEFLGDAFLDAIVGAELFRKMDHVTEGTLTKTRAQIVCEKALAEIARSLNLGRYLLMGHGEASTGGRNKESILADALEAIIGAIYLDGGYEAAREFTVRIFQNTIDEAINGKIFSDYKSELQEVLQSGGNRVNIHYVTDSEEGPPHRKTFYVHMEYDGKILGKGIGKTKKEAEQNAAKESLRILERRKTDVL